MTDARNLFTLAVFGLLAGGLLTVVAEWTDPYIQANRAEQRLRMFAEILPGTLLQKPESEWQTCAPWHSGTVVSNGYAGEIEFAYVWHHPQAQLRFRTVRHQETPGFGDFIEAEWLSEKDDWQADQWASLDTVSGATITFNAVQRATKQLFTQLPVTCRDR